MSGFRFRMPLDWKLSSYHANSVFVVGLDGVPWPCKVKVDTESVAPVLDVKRNQTDSGRLYITYPLRDRGEMIICTGTLPERESAYDLLTELARGTLNRLRNQVSIWQEGGLVIADSIGEKVSAAIHWLGTAIMTADRPEQDRLAGDSIELAMDAIFELCQSFGKQITQYRREHTELGQFWLANATGRNDQFIPSSCHTGFDLLQVVDTHCHHEFSEVSKRLVLGPWLDASAGGMAEDLVEVDDFLARRDLLILQCRQRLEELPAKTALLHLVSGLNGIGHRHLSYPQQQQLAVDLLQLVDDSLIEIPVMVSFDFPWAERLAGSVGGIHPLQIADSLLRHGSRIAFLGLDVNLDYWPNGSAIRDPLQWIDLIDVWAQLDLPLVICMRVPSGGKPVAADCPVDRMINQQRSNVNEEQRLEFLQTVLPMLIARPTVHGIIWRQWQDDDDPRYPYGGIIDADGGEKPIMRVIDDLKNVIGRD